MQANVPLRNVYYLLCYAWRRHRERELVKADALKGSQGAALIAKIIHDGIAHLLRRGLDRGYRSFAHETSQPRGKLLVNATIQRGLLQHGRAVCEQDELTRDILNNQILLAAMNTLIELPADKLPESLRSDLCRLRPRLAGISAVELSPALFDGLRFHRNNAHYGFWLQVCELLARQMIADRRSGLRSFHDFTASPQLMGLVFEDFVREFLTREQSRYAVRRVKLRWRVHAAADASRLLLPRMRPDILLDDGNEQIILDTKYYRNLLGTNPERERMLSIHLYQMFAYASNYSFKPGCRRRAFLLYAESGRPFSLEYEFDDFTLHAATIDLQREWTEIHGRLLALFR